METATYRDRFASGGYSAKGTLGPVGRAHTTSSTEDTMNPVLEQINRTADHPSVAAYLPVALAERLIELAGGERVREGVGRWVFPDNFWTWDDGEALRYALEVLPDLAD
jgi:hypothetical protein